MDLREQIDKVMQLKEEIAQKQLEVREMDEELKIAIINAGKYHYLSVNYSLLRRR